jgi:hypothetical protein
MPDEVFRFSHVHSFVTMLYECYELNERILAGDIISAKAALPKARKLCLKYSRLMAGEGASNIHLDPYVASGGWLGLSWSYSIGDFSVQGAQTPRRP